MPDLPNLGFQATRWVYLCSLALWLGGTAFFGFAVAPVLFRDLPSREQAGRLVHQILARFDKVKHILVFLVLGSHGLWVWRWAPTPGFWSTIRWLALAMMILAHGGVTLFILPRMQTLRAAMGSLDAIPADQPERVAYGRLHRRASQLTRLMLAAGLLALFLS